MRWPLLALALLLLAVPVAVAQNPKLAVETTVPVGPLPEGEAAQVRLTITRVCSNAAQVAPETELAVTFLGPNGTTFDGPGRVPLEQQSCAVEPQQARQATYAVTLPQDVEPATTVTITFVVSDPRDGTPVTPTADSYTGSFALSKAPAEHAETAADQDSAAAGATRGAPSMGLALLLAALAGTLWARRHA